MISRLSVALNFGDIAEIVEQVETAVETWLSIANEMEVTPKLTKAISAAVQEAKRW